MDPIAVIIAAPASSGVLIFPCITLDIDASIRASTVESIGFTMRGIAESHTSVGKK